MNGFSEPLPGLLDDPQLHISNLSTLPDLHIAPLRDPAPSRHVNAPLPIEPLTKSSNERRHGARKAAVVEEQQQQQERPLSSRLKPSDLLSAREGKKPHLAISELLETSQADDLQSSQLPSFVSLAVVEKSPIPEPTDLSPHKRLRLDLDNDGSSRDVGRRLPRPAQQDGKQTRPVPLLPAMVTGLHEPPPSARILPSMDPDVRPDLTRSTTTTKGTASSKKMQVKDILTDSSKRSSSRMAPEAMLNTPDLAPTELFKPQNDNGPRNQGLPDPLQEIELTIAPPRKDIKTRRARRKWSEQETAHLLEGVKKHGVGKWKQILVDSAYEFHDRTSIDLKDRYRVFTKDSGDNHDADTTATATANKLTQDQGSQDADSTTTLDTENDRSHEPINQNSDIPTTAAAATEITRTKRKRRPWTAAEDAALISGVTKYGFQWTAIHGDAEFDLGHRRATDLRDRVRNLYPDSYRQAGTRPLKSELKKTAVTARRSDISTSNSAAARPVPSGSLTAPGETSTDLSLGSRGKSTIANDAGSRNGATATNGKARKRGTETNPPVENAGVTLPSLALDDDDELDWGDNTLPPLLEWDEIGM